MSGKSAGFGRALARGWRYTVGPVALSLVVGAGGCGPTRTTSEAEPPPTHLTLTAAAPKVSLDQIADRAIGAYQRQGGRFVANLPRFAVEVSPDGGVRFKPSHVPMSGHGAAAHAIGG